MTSKYLARDTRTDQITAAALTLAERSPGGYRSLSREAIAQAAEVSPALVSARMGTMESVRRLIIRAAIKAGNARVVAQGLAVGDPHARKAPDALRQKAAKLITG